MMVSNDYALKLNDQLLHDQTEPSNSQQMEIDALVASGDCFVTLATQLDGISHQLLEKNEQPELERVIRSLLYLQRHYAISKKQSDYRQ